ncbi:hypothetical protein GH722_01310 [Alphaproteobacteria bacterium HT1-32]|nr:hypothetical protein [Alphaproteobacteria bacterium HT1-32]
MGDKRAKTSEKSQSDKFVEAARELEADESEDAFELSLRRIAEQKPKQEKETPDK